MFSDIKNIRKHLFLLSGVVFILFLSLETISSLAKTGVFDHLDNSQCELCLDYEENDSENEFSEKEIGLITEEKKLLFQHLETVSLKKSGVDAITSLSYEIQVPPPKHLS